MPTLLLSLAEMAQADTIIIDSLKDAAVGLSEDEVGAGYNRARQLCLASGVEVLELHHMVKRGANGSKPNELADVYGSTWLTSGAGSVLLLWGAAGDAVVAVSHLKQPMGMFGPMQVIHDHQAGTTMIYHQSDPLAMMRLAGDKGLTVKALACTLEETDKPEPAAIERARRKLDDLVKRSLATRRDPPEGASGSAAVVTYHATHASLTDVLDILGVTAPTDHSRKITNPQVSGVTESLTALTDETTHGGTLLFEEGVPHAVRPSHRDPTDEVACNDCGKPTEIRTIEVNHGYCTACAIERR